MNTPGHQFVELCGAIHIHTIYSDGGVSFPTLIAAAKRAGLDFIVINDHMTLRGKFEGYEGCSGNLLVVVGYEHQDKHNRNHYLILGVENVINDIEKAQNYISRAKEMGGIGFLAHPMERRHYFKKYPPYPWTDWNVTGFDGIELWNQMSEWVENLKKLRSVYRIFYPRRFLKSVAPELLRRWDELNRGGMVSGIGGVDAHTIKIRFGFFSIELFPIKVELKGIRTHVYMIGALPFDEPKRARQMLLDALRDGHGFISNYRRGDARGTRICIQNMHGELIPPGRPEKPTIPPVTLHVNLPASAQIRLIRNGVWAQSHKGMAADFAINAPGIYRIEAYRRNKAWIYSNPMPIGTYPF